MTFRRTFAAAVALVPLTFVAAAHAAPPAAPPNDAFIAGYAAAVLERELSIKPDGLSVSGGHVTLDHPALSPAEQATVTKILATIPGVVDVTVVGDATTTTPASGESLDRIGVTTETAETTTVTKSSPSTVATATVDGTHLATDDTPLTLYLGVGRTFAPVLADPRWPHFYASYHKYDIDRNDSTRLDNVASVGFGETISLVRQTYASGFRWEAGVQGALFAIFDLDSDSKDLINADYFVGPYVAARQGNLSAMLRVYHQSSHLGDEYLLRGNSEPRENYSFETANLLVSYDLPKGFRVYGGVGYLFDVDPDDIEPWTAQYGVEWVSPTTVFGTNWVRPVVAFDGQNRENNDWAFSYSIHAGVQLEDPSRFSQRLQIMLEYYDGNSPDGQFYDDHIRFYGIGAHFYF